MRLHPKQRWFTHNLANIIRSLNMSIPDLFAWLQLADLCETAAYFESNNDTFNIGSQRLSNGAIDGACYELLSQGMDYTSSSL